MLAGYDRITNLMDNKENSTQTLNYLLSALTDNEPNIYEMTRDMARVAKQIKEDTKEDPEPPKPVIEAIKAMYNAKVV